jgi:hypothetical protein
MIRMRRRRIWCELIDPEELGSEATLALLERFQLEPLIALPPSRENEAMAIALHRLTARGIRVGVWPLLDDRDGYWPSEANVVDFERRVDEALRFGEKAGAPIETLAIDLEPPLEITSRLMKRDPAAITSLLFSSVQDLTRSELKQARFRAIDRYRALVESLKVRGIETVAAIAPPLVLDLAAGGALWQRILKTPLSGIGFQVITPMLYTSQMRELLPFASGARARALLHALSRLLFAHAGDARPCVSLGLVSTGKLGDELSFRDPAELLLDVEATLAAGIDDLALFSLEGVLRRGAPETWLVPYTTARPRAPLGATSEAISALVRGFVWSLRSARRLSPRAMRTGGSCADPRVS